MLVLAAADVATESGGLDLLTQYGVLGIGLAVLGVFARAAYKREVDRSDRLEAEVFRLHAAIQDRHIPALEAAAHALEDATLALQAIQQRQDVDRAVAERDRDRRDGGRGR